MAELQGARSLYILSSSAERVIDHARKRTKISAIRKPSKPRRGLLFIEEMIRLNSFHELLSALTANWVDMCADVKNVTLYRWRHH